MKAPRGRPKLECHVRQIRVTLSLRDDEDDDLLLFFTSIPNGRRAAAIKSALRAGGARIVTGSVNNDDLDLTIQGLVFG